MESDSDGQVDAKRTFESMKEKLQRDLRARFDYWLDGFTHDKYFHGWPNLPDYKKCFCFKWKQAGTQHRLYGFLDNPRPNDPGFQVCVLVTHDQKTDETNFGVLDHINDLRVTAMVRNAVRQCFPGEEDKK